MVNEVSIYALIGQTTDVVGGETDQSANTNKTYKNNDCAVHPKNLEVAPWLRDIARGSNDGPPAGIAPCRVLAQLAHALLGTMTMSFSLPELPYAHDALVPYMSRETLEFHHDKHHLAYVNNGNNLIKGTEWEGKPLEEVVQGAFGKNPGLFNNAGQHYNHLNFWKWMKPNGGGAVPGKLEKALVDSFGSVDAARGAIVDAGTTQFGSGWAWLAVVDGKILATKTPNGESPLVHKGVPILGVDVWEHSYYIDYRNRRPDYLKAFVEKLVNWEYVAELYEAAIK